MYELNVTDQFKRDYQSLTQVEKQAIKQALERMKSDLRHPSLRVKKMQGRDAVWEARASRELPIIFQFEGSQTVLLRSCGHHDRALRG